MHSNYIVYIKTIILIFLSIFLSTKIYSQNWERNKETEFFVDKVVYSFGYIDNTLWSVTDEGLCKIEKDSVNIYCVDSNFVGELNKNNIRFIKKYCYTSPKKLLFSKNKFWLIPINISGGSQMEYIYFYMIQNDSVYSVKLPSLEVSNTKDLEINRYYDLWAESLDKEGNIYLLVRERNVTNNNAGFERFLLLYSNGKKDFQIKEFPLSLVGEVDLGGFFIYNDLFCYIVNNNSDIKSQTLLIYKNDTLVFKYNFSEDKRYEFLYTRYYYQKINENISDTSNEIDKNFYFLFSISQRESYTSKASFYLIKLDTLFNVTKYFIPFEQSWSNDFTFLVNNNSLFISSYKGFFKYDIIGEKLDSIKEVFRGNGGNYNIDDLFFRNLYVKDNFIVGTYLGLKRLGDPVNISKGLYFYKFK